MAQVIVVGGGLTGLSACHTVLERGGRVLLLDKNSFLGGNSTKATSGINGALTNTQIKLDIPDSAEIFYQDTAKSARDLLDPGLVKVLTYNSASAVEWLQEKFNLDLSLVSRLGGHSQPRTHRGKERFPGMTITYALMEKLEDLAQEQPDRVRIIKKADVKKLIKEGEVVVGVEYAAADGSVGKEYGPVILSTGGYAADFTNSSLIKQHRPEIYNLPTTNGDWSTGDGIKMATAIGANAVTLDKIQVHPTGLVDPNEPDSKNKFLAAEALRGVGGLLLTADGKRFCDELGHRDYVTGEMWKNKGPFRLVLNSAAGKEIEWHCKHYTGRGLMKFFKNGHDLAKEIGISSAALQATFHDYNEIGRGNKKDPYGKKFFQNANFDLNDSFWVAIVCPVLHFTMGGIEIDPESQVRAGTNKTVIPGLYAAGEVAGGVHGANRLGGSSLLACVVYGRVAGGSAAKYLLENMITKDPVAQRRLAGIAGHLAGEEVVVNVKISNAAPDTRITLDLSWDGSSQSAPKVTAAAAAPAPPVKKEMRDITAAEVAKHNKDDDCWVIVNGEVLDVTKFLPDHPGGKKAILLFAGKDATEEFNMLHKPDVVAKYAPETVIGRLKQ